MAVIGISVRILMVSYLSLAPALSSPVRGRGGKEPIPCHVKSASLNDDRYRRLRRLAALRRLPGSPGTGRLG